MCHKRSKLEHIVKVSVWRAGLPIVNTSCGTCTDIIGLLLQRVLLLTACSQNQYTMADIPWQTFVCMVCMVTSYSFDYTR
jgi:hypothetical protein